MRGMRINESEFYYALYLGTEELYSKDGYRTGERSEMYSAPRSMRANISPATGQSRIEQFGNYEDYSKVILLFDMDCPIDENTVLWVDKVPVINEDGTTDTPHDYVVKHISKSLNVISYAIDKVNVGK